MPCNDILRSVLLSASFAALFFGARAYAQSTDVSSNDALVEEITVSSDTPSLAGLTPAAAAERITQTLSPEEASALAICVSNCFGWSASPFWVTSTTLQSGSTDLVKIVNTVQLYYPCGGCAPTRARGIATTRRYAAVSRVQLGQDAPATPSIRLGVATGLGGVIFDNNRHVNSGSACCVSATTNATFIGELHPGDLGIEAFWTRTWVSFRWNGQVHEYTQLSEPTPRLYTHGGVGDLGTVCVGAGCAGL